VTSSSRGGPDDLVLLGLDGGHDVQHLAGPGPLELGQQGISSPQPVAGRFVAGPPEAIVGDGDHLPPVDHHLAARSGRGVVGPRSVEGHGNGSPPIDHDRIPTVVLDVAASDVPRRSRLLVDAAEEKGSFALASTATRWARAA
jgi:hypothetical protein